MFGANGIASIPTAPTAYAPTIAGRRPTLSTNLPAGPSAMVGATAATANAIPVQTGGRCRISTTSTGTRALRTPNDDQPCARFARHAAMNRGSLATRRNGTGSVTGPVGTSRDFG